MAYALPVFNLTMDVWTFPNTPFGGAASFLGIACQAYTWSKAPFPAPPWLQIRMPIDLVNTYTVNDILEIPAGSGRWFKAQFYYRMHEGFANEYWGCNAYPCDNAGVLIVPGLP